MINGNSDYEFTTIYHLLLVVGFIFYLVMG